MLVLRITNQITGLPVGPAVPRSGAAPGGPKIFYSGKAAERWLTMSKLTNKFSKGANIDWGINTEGYPYHRLKEMVVGETYVVLGVFVTSSEQYGKSPVAITDGALINLPQHLVPEIEEIRRDEEMIAEIKSGKVGMRVYAYDSKHRKDCRSIEWVDINE